MTELLKKISRRVTLFLDNRITARERDRVTVTLHPDNTIGFRGYKCKREYRLPLVVAYKMAIKSEAIEALKVKQQQARLAGKRMRKPRRSSLLFQ